MTRFVNTDTSPRSWSALVNEDTGRGLTLGPGEECELALAADEDFDPYLKPVGGGKRGKVDKREAKDEDEGQVDSPARPSAIPVV